jgi:hypothetical protein
VGRFEQELSRASALGRVGRGLGADGSPTDQRFLFLVLEPDRFRSLRLKKPSLGSGPGPGSAAWLGLPAEWVSLGIGAPRRRPGPERDGPISSRAKGRQASRPPPGRADLPPEAIPAPRFHSKSLDLAPARRPSGGGRADHNIPNCRIMMCFFISDRGPRQLASNPDWFYSSKGEVRGVLFRSCSALFLLLGAAGVRGARS